MKAIVQRVRHAKVVVDNQEVSSIGPGICVLLGISKDDTRQDLDWMVRKLLNVRVFEDESGKRWAKSTSELKREILLAMGTDESKATYEQFLSQLRSSYEPQLVKDGVFGAYMQVHIENDGPVTLQLESTASAKNE